MSPKYHVHDLKNIHDLWRGVYDVLDANMAALNDFHSFNVYHRRFAGKVKFTCWKALQTADKQIVDVFVHSGPSSNQTEDTASIGSIWL